MSGQAGGATRPALTISEQHDAQGDLLFAFTLHGATHSRRALDDLAAVVHARAVWAVSAHQHAPDDQPLDRRPDAMTTEAGAR
jgi:hypothetical protein